MFSLSRETATDWLGHRRTFEAEREARDEARRERQNALHTAFHRQTLLGLQEATLEVARTSSFIQSEDLAAHRKTGEWHKQRVSEKLGEESRLAFARTSMLTVRVQDDEVRKLAQTFKDKAVAIELSSGPEESNFAGKEMSEIFIRLQERIGELLRRFDVNEDPN